MAALSPSEYLAPMIARAIPKNRPANPAAREYIPQPLNVHGAAARKSIPERASKGPPSQGIPAEVSVKKIHAPHATAPKETTHLNVNHIVAMNRVT
jgi:hypothetical protein